MAMLPDQPLHDRIDPSQMPFRFADQLIERRSR
jgi:hypothetical protein